MSQDFYIGWEERMPAAHAKAVRRVVLAFADPSDGYVTGQTVHVSGGRYMA